MGLKNARNLLVFDVEIFLGQRVVRCIDTELKPEIEAGGCFPRARDADDDHIGPVVILG